MKPIRHLLRVTITVLAIAITAPVLLTAEDTHSKKTKPFQDPAYLNKPLSYWLGIIRDRDEKMISTAFDAIRALGPDGVAAVPDLTRLVAAPFAPIRIGIDSHEAIASKVYDIALRDRAIDTLTMIGEAASTSALPLVRWALTQRIQPGLIRNDDDDELFLELVVLDTNQRMRVAGALSEFGPNAAPVIAALISSREADKRKLGVAILSESALPIAAELLRSSKCDERSLGFQIMKDMELVVARPYLDELMKRLVCDAD